MKRLIVTILSVALFLGLTPGMAFPEEAAVYGAAKSDTAAEPLNKTTLAELENPAPAAVPNRKQIRKTREKDLPKQTSRQQSPGLRKAQRKAGALLPAAYDLRAENLSTGVRDQGNWGTCWAFSALGAVESNVLKQKADTGASTASDAASLDLSEMQLAYNGSKAVSASDAVKGSKVDKDQIGEALGITYYSGAYQLSGAQLLTSWRGVTTESNLPYGSISYRKTLATSKRFATSVRVTDVEILAAPVYYDEDDNAKHSMEAVEEIKKAIYENGAVDASVYADMASAGDTDHGEYFNYAQSSSFVPGSEVIGEEIQLDHGVTIVGWDDNYSKENFVYTPEGDGAFLCKNSWGVGNWGLKDEYETRTKGALKTHFTATNKDGKEVDVELYNDGTVRERDGEKGLIFQGGTTKKQEGDTLIVSSDSGESCALKIVRRNPDALTWQGYYWMSYYDMSFQEASQYKAETAQNPMPGTHLYQYDYLGMSFPVTTESGQFDGETTPVLCANVFQTTLDKEKLTAVSAMTEDPGSKVSVTVYELTSASQKPNQGKKIASASATYDKAGYHTLRIANGPTLRSGRAYAIVEKIVNQDGQGYLPLELAGEEETVRLGKQESYASQDGGKTWHDMKSQSLSQMWNEDVPKELEGFGNVMIRMYTSGGVTPTKVSISKGKFTKVTRNKTSLTVSWKKLKKGQKYQLAYRKKGNKSWKTISTSSTKKTIKKLSRRKKYQLRVRGTQSANGKTYYGSWSATKTVSTR